MKQFLVKLFPPFSKFQFERATQEEIFYA